MKQWDEAFMSDPVNTVLAPVDLSNVDVPTYLLYGQKDTFCPADTNKLALKKIPTVKRAIDYEKFGTLSFYKTEPEILADVITILGSGAKTIAAAASALTLLSVV